MKMTLDLPPGLIREMKLRAVNEHRKLKEVAADLLQRGLAAGATSTADNFTEKVLPFPLFPTSPDAPISHMTTEELLSLEQETLHSEDLRRLGLSL